MLLRGKISLILEARFVGSANQKDPPIVMVRPQGTSNPPNDHIPVFIQHVLERQNVASSSFKLNCCVKTSGVNDDQNGDITFYTQWLEQCFVTLINLPVSVK